MTTRITRRGMAALSLLALGFAALPSAAIAQDTNIGGAEAGSNEQLDKPISLEVHSANLFYALTLLFDQLKAANYTLPEALKQQQISAHFTNLPLRTALETLLKNSGYTYKIERGVYGVVPKRVAPIDNPIDVPSPSDAGIKSKKIYRLTNGQLLYNSVDIVTRLGGRVLPGPAGLPGGSASAIGNRTGSFGSGGIGNGLSGGIGGFGTGLNGGGGIVGGLNGPGSNGPGESGGLGANGNDSGGRRRQGGF